MTSPEKSRSYSVVCMHACTQGVWDAIVWLEQNACVHVCVCMREREKETRVMCSVTVEWCLRRSKYWTELRSDWFGYSCHGKGNSRWWWWCICVLFLGNETYYFINICPGYRPPLHPGWLMQAIIRWQYVFVRPVFKLISSMVNLVKYSKMQFIMLPC